MPPAEGSRRAATLGVPRGRELHRQRAFIRNALLRAIDVAWLAAAFLLAYELRFEFRVPFDEQTRALAQLPLVLALQWLVIWAGGIYRLMPRYIGLAEAIPFARAAVCSLLALLA